MGRIQIQVQVLITHPQLPSPLRTTVALNRTQTRHLPRISRRRLGTALKREVCSLIPGINTTQRRKLVRSGRMAGIIDQTLEERSEVQLHACTGN
jgi:hypothetical protein